MKFCSKKFFLKSMMLSCFLLSNFSAFAQDDISDLAKKLQEQRMKAEAENAKVQAELTELEAKKSQLTIRQNEIAESSAKTLLAVKEDAPLATLDSVMTSADNFKPCTVSRGKEANEYFIEGKDAKNNKMIIRFHFAGERSLFKPVLRPFKYETVHLTEIYQEGFTPGDDNKKGFMSATIRLDENFKAVHAVFTGELIYDQMLGFSSSYQPTVLTCLIL